MIDNVSEPYIAKHGKYYAIEQKVNGKTKHLLTLNVKKLLENAGRKPQALNNTLQLEDKMPEKCVHDLLSEQSKPNASEEDLLKSYINQAIEVLALKGGIKNHGEKSSKRSRER